MRLRPVEFFIADAYGREMPWLSKVHRLPGCGLWFAWLVGEHVPANDENFETCRDAQPLKSQDTLAP
jgi:hypothetical protein